MRSLILRRDCGRLPRIRDTECGQQPPNEEVIGRRADNLRGNDNTLITIKKRRQRGVVFTIIIIMANVEAYYGPLQTLRPCQVVVGDLLFRFPSFTRGPFLKGIGDNIKVSRASIIAFDDIRLY